MDAKIRRLRPTTKSECLAFCKNTSKFYSGKFRRFHDEFIVGFDTSFNALKDSTNYFALVYIIHLWAKSFDGIIKRRWRGRLEMLKI
ncbi:unnamed protein product [Bursaphelenchus xylophilus]|uniref:(pine wood nematode) hypothetical protein n=1 Tax=Bursaphelenchus xylophilus TaxID=6326 RepID=A0A1I7RUF8_BURXY|nr:unnamed protein product [Bursaphelenchus xylophilus]CAG9114096.1 unnamed protein product [Bursaphelenchus xylophilus]